MVRSVSNIAGVGECFHPMFLISAEWHDGSVYVNTGVEEVVNGSVTYLPFGEFCAIEVPAEGYGLAVEEATIHLAASLDAILDEIGTDIEGKTVTVRWCGTSKAAGGEIVVGPLVLFKGTWARREFQMDSGSYDMALTVAFGPSARSGADVMHSAEDQRALYLSDTCGRFLIHLEKQRSNPLQIPE